VEVLEAQPKVVGLVVLAVLEQGQDFQLLLALLIQSP
jgi:hypothetical protein